MTRLHQRVAKLEKRCGESREVARIIGLFRRASDEELYRLVKSDRLARMAERLNDSELERLITELKPMLAVMGSN